MIKVLYNYFPEFSQIQAGNCKRPLMGPTWPNKNWVVQPLIQSGGSYK
jgi:hypothetical protein